MLYMAQGIGTRCHGLNGEPFVDYQRIILPFLIKIQKDVFGIMFGMLHQQLKSRQTICHVIGLHVLLTRMQGHVLLTTVITMNQITQGHITKTATANGSPIPLISAGKILIQP